MRRVIFAWLVLAPVAALALADDVYLTNGRRLSGVIVDRTPTSITLQVGPGRLTLPLDRVVRVVEGRSSLAQFRERAQQLAPSDVQGWLDLAVWAQQHDLLTQAREAFEHVLSVEPQNGIAQQALGNVRLGDRWVSPEESYRARGYVLFEGAWVTPEERDGRLDERAEQARAAAERARAETEAREEESRVREAEARAREAEARQRDAELFGAGLGLPIGGLAPPCLLPDGCPAAPQPPCNATTPRHASRSHRASPPTAAPGRVQPLPEDRAAMSDVPRPRSRAGDSAAVPARSAAHHPARSAGRPARAANNSERR